MTGMVNLIAGTHESDNCNDALDFVVLAAIAVCLRQFYRLPTVPCYAGGATLRTSVN